MQDASGASRSYTFTNFKTCLLWATSTRSVPSFILLSDMNVVDPLSLNLGPWSPTSCDSLLLYQHLLHNSNCMYLWGENNRREWQDVQVRRLHRRRIQQTLLSYVSTGRHHLSCTTQSPNVGAGVKNLVQQIAIHHQWTLQCLWWQTHAQCQQQLNISPYTHVYIDLCNAIYVYTVATHVMPSVLGVLPLGARFCSTDNP